MRKFIPYYKDFKSDYLLESDSHVEDLKKAITDIDDEVKFEDGDDKLDLIIKIGDIELANRLRKYILQNEDEFKIKTVEAYKINNIKLRFKSKEELDKEEQEKKDQEAKVKDDTGINMDSPTTDDVTNADKTMKGKEMNTP